VLAPFSYSSHIFTSQFPTTSYSYGGHIVLILIYRFMSGMLTITRAATAVNATPPMIDQIPMPDDFLSLCTNDWLGFITDVLLLSATPVTLLYLMTSIVDPRVSAGSPFLRAID